MIIHHPNEYAFLLASVPPPHTWLTLVPCLYRAGEDTEHWRAPIEVKFEIPYFTVSGLQVRYLKIIEKSGYQALPWVRYITTNGNYQLRMS